MEKIQILVFVFTISVVLGYKLDIHTCQQIEDKINFKIIALQCVIEQNGLYTFNGIHSPLQNVDTIFIDRATEHIFIHVKRVESLKTIKVSRGNCENIAAPNTVKVIVEGNICPQNVPTSNEPTSDGVSNVPTPNEPTSDRVSDVPTPNEPTSDRASNVPTPNLPTSDRVSNVPTPNGPTSDGVSDHNSSCFRKKKNDIND